MVISNDGLTLYVVDYSNGRIRAIVIASRQVTTLVGAGTGTFFDPPSSFSYPVGIEISNDGTTLYLGDRSNNRIRSIDIATHTVTTLAGSSSGSADGTATAAKFNGGERGLWVAISPNGLALFVADSNNHLIREIEIASRTVTTLAGMGSGAFVDGTGADASFNQPLGLVVTPDSSRLLVADRGNNRIRAIVIGTDVVTTLAGSGASGFDDGTGAAAIFNAPQGLAITSDGATLFVADSSNNRIRIVTIATGVVTTLAGSGSAGSTDSIGGGASFYVPIGVEVSNDGAKLFVGDDGNNLIWLYLIQNERKSPGFRFSLSV